MTRGLPAYSKSQGGPLLVVLSGPSGVGKDAALNRLRTLDRPWYFVVTATTRPMRPGERNGFDYIFLQDDQFQAMLKEGEFLEHAQVYGNWYGVPKQQARDAMAEGMDVILKVDVQGAATIKNMAPDAVFVFLVPHSMDELKERLQKRATETDGDLELRSGIVEVEMRHLSAFDYRVVNRDGCLDDAVGCIDSIIQAERCRIPPRQVSL